MPNFEHIACGPDGEKDYKPLKVNADGHLIVANSSPIPTASQVEITDGSQQVSITDVAGKKSLDVNVTSINIDHSSDSISTLDKYNINNLEDNIPLYAGFTDSSGKYLLKRFNESTGSMDYANNSNNSGVTAYADAWTNRATLTYSKFHELTGV